MRSLVDLVESLSSTMRFIIGAFVLCGFLFGLFMTIAATYVAPKIAQDYGERATELGERAIAEARAAERDRELAKDGWGYGAATAEDHGIGADDGHARSRNVDEAGGWGEGTE